jgi:ribosome-associated heat shock protein Hsp15
MNNADKSTPAERLRIDKWLWAARFYKTRSLSTEEVTKGRVTLNGQACKPSREIKIGDLISVKRLDLQMDLTVLGLSHQRGPAPVAQSLYQETDESKAARINAAEQRRIAPEPAHSIAEGRPTKRDRRALQNHQNTSTHTWNDRWSASLDD